MTGAAASAPPDASAPIKASLPPAADTETFAFVAAVVLNVAGSKGGRLKKVFSFVFGTLAGAFADKLRTFEGGIPAASDGGFAGRAADTGVAVGCFCLIAMATC